MGKLTLLKMKSCTDCFFKSFSCAIPGMLPNFKKTQQNNFKKITVWQVSISVVFLVRPRFPAFGLNIIRRDTEYLFVFSPNTGKYGPEKLQIETLFTQWINFSITYQWNSFPCRTTALNIPSNTKPPKQNIKYQYWLFCSCSTKSHMQNIPCKKKSERGNKALTMRIKSDFFCVISFYFCNHVGVSKWL